MIETFTNSMKPLIDIGHSGLTIFALLLMAYLSSFLLALAVRALLCPKKLWEEYRGSDYINPCFTMNLLDFMEYRKDYL